MGRAQDKGKKSENMALSAEETSGVQADTKTRALNKLELSEMIERVEGEIRTQDGDNAKTPKMMPAFLGTHSETLGVDFLQEEPISSAGQSGTSCVLQEAKKEKYTEEITQPDAFIAVTEERNRRGVSFWPKSPRGLLLLGMLIGLLIGGGGVLFILGYGLLGEGAVF